MFLKVYSIALTVFFAMDMLWLGVVAKDFYRARIGALMSGVKTRAKAREDA